MKTLILGLALLITPSAFAASRCVEECSKAYGLCVVQGSSNRSGALHLNEMLNAADPTHARRWNRSRCDRTISATPDSSIESSGADCVEKGRPNPKDGISSEIAGIVSGQMVEGSLELNGDAKIQFWAEGYAIQNERVMNLSRHRGSLIVEAGNQCYSIN